MPFVSMRFHSPSQHPYALLMLPRFPRVRGRLGHVHPLLLQRFLPDSHGEVDMLFRSVDQLRSQDRDRKRAHGRSVVPKSVRYRSICGPLLLTWSA